MIIPIAFPFAVPKYAEDDWWTDDGDDNKVREAEDETYTLREYSFGTYYVTDENAVFFLVSVLMVEW